MVSEEPCIARVKLGHLPSRWHSALTFSRPTSIELTVMIASVLIPKLTAIDVVGLRVYDTSCRSKSHER